MKQMLEFDTISGNMQVIIPHIKQVDEIIKSTTTLSKPETKKVTASELGITSNQLFTCSDVPYLLEMYLDTKLLVTNTTSVSHDTAILEYVKIVDCYSVVVSTKTYKSSDLPIPFLTKEEAKAAYDEILQAMRHYYNKELPCLI